MRVLDRTCFAKKIPISAARVFNNKHISRLRTELDRGGDLLVAHRCKFVQPDPDDQIAATGGKCFLLQPEVKHDGELLLIR